MEEFYADLQKYNKQAIYTLANYYRMKGSYESLLEQIAEKHSRQIANMPTNTRYLFFGKNKSIPDEILKIMKPAKIGSNTVSKKYVYYEEKDIEVNNNQVNMQSLKTAFPTDTLDELIDKREIIQALIQFGELSVQERKEVIDEIWNESDKPPREFYEKEGSWIALAIDTDKNVIYGTYTGTVRTDDLQRPYNDSSMISIRPDYQGRRLCQPLATFAYKAVFEEYRVAYFKLYVAAKNVAGACRCYYRAAIDNGFTVYIEGKEADIKECERLSTIIEEMIILTGLTPFDEEMLKVRIYNEVNSEYMFLDKDIPLDKFKPLPALVPHVIYNGKHIRINNNGYVSQTEEKAEEINALIDKKAVKKIDLTLIEPLPKPVLGENKWAVLAIDIGNNVAYGSFTGTIETDDKGRRYSTGYMFIHQAYRGQELCRPFAKWGLKNICEKYEISYFKLWINTGGACRCYYRAAIDNGFTVYINGKKAEIEDCMQGESNMIIMCNDTPFEEDMTRFKSQMLSVNTEYLFFGKNKNLPLEKFKGIPIPKPHVFYENHWFKLNENNHVGPLTVKNVLGLTGDELREKQSEINQLIDNGELQIIKKSKDTKMVVYPNFYSSPNSWVALAIDVDKDVVYGIYDGSVEDDTNISSMIRISPAYRGKGLCQGLAAFAYRSVVEEYGVKKFDITIAAKFELRPGACRCYYRAAAENGYRVFIQPYDIELLNPGGCTPLTDVTDLTIVVP